MVMRIGVGLDPGPTNFGWAQLDMSKIRPVWLCAGVCTPDEFCEKMLVLCRGSELVAIERPKAVHKAEANANVVDAAWEGGGVARLLRYLGCNVIEVDPTSWQTCLIGHPRKGQNRVAMTLAELPRRIDRMPKITSYAKLQHAADGAAILLRGWAEWTMRRRTGS